MKVEASDLFSCGQCESSFVTKWSLESHMKAFHPQPKVSPTITPTQQHLESHPGRKRGRKWEEECQLPKADGNHPCQLCDKVFLLKEELTQHHSTSHSEVTITLTTPKEYAPNPKKPKSRVSLLKRQLTDTEGETGSIKIKNEPVDTDFDIKDVSNRGKLLFNPLEINGSFEITEVVRSLLISHMNAESGREAEASKTKTLFAAAPQKVKCTANTTRSPGPFKSESDDEEDEFEGEGSESHAGQSFEHMVVQANPTIKSHHNSKTFPCTECGASFRAYYLLERHMEHHNAASRPHKCHICGDSRGFVRKEHLKKHIASCHSGMKFTCEFCGKDISRRDHLVRHIRSVHRCPIPPGLDLLAAAASNMQLATTASSMTLTQSELDEISDKTLQSMQPKPKKPYTKCDMCTRTFTHLEALFQHQREAHSDIRKYNCEFCSKSFKRREHLQKHVVLHTGEKKFTCEHCTKSFPRRDALQDHLRRIHGALHPTDAEEFPCSLCDKIFMQHSNLVRHRNQVHNITLAVAIANRGNLFEEDGDDTSNPTPPMNPVEKTFSVMDVSAKKMKRPPLPGLLPIENFHFLQNATKVGKC